MRRKGHDFGGIITTLLYNLFVVAVTIGLALICIAFLPPAGLLIVAAGITAITASFLWWNNL